ncbi:hypothetical protein PTE30175_04690 [Pandoraea terrae]|uniref:PduX n=1 Tax=Pandoraea terrae TaxID=1537710 RepID=A0A5E4YWP6_9BURK|nr:DUF1302 family protein [Pandoraea terrae]VVE52530.1 hypothetical protein PTE30175_04690 [Pandoraea terrae]
MRIQQTALAAAAMALVSTAPAYAGDTIEFDNGVMLDWALTTTYTAGMRVKNPDAILSGAANGGANDGDNNFRRGSLTTNRLAGLFESKIYKGQTGFVFSGSSFYDDVYHRSNDNTGPINTVGPVDQFTRSARFYQGGYTRLLDAYAYSTFDVGSTRATVRAGQHVVNWGEALYFPSMGLAQGPADGTKTGIPGTETKDQLLPEGQVSTSVQMNSRWTLLGQLQFDWHPTLAPAVGSFLSGSDATGPGAQCLQPVINGVCTFGRRGSDIAPSNFGQWGTGTRYRVSDETEVGLYYLNYKDRTPLPVINSFVPGGAYNIKYFDNVHLIGATFSTLVGSKTTLAGEITQKIGAPVFVDTIVSPATKATVPTPTRANILQANLNALVNMGRTPLADSLTLIGEVSYVHVSNVTSIKAPGVESLGAAAAFFPSSDSLSMARDSVAASATASFSYPGIFTDWDLTVPISYSQQLAGASITGGVGGGKGDKRYSLGLNFTFRNNLQIALNYLGYLGSPSIKLPYTRQLTDRDQVSIVAKYKF